MRGGRTASARGGGRRRRYRFERDHRSRHRAGVLARRRQNPTGCHPGRRSGDRSRRPYVPGCGVHGRTGDFGFPSRRCGRRAGGAGKDGYGQIAFRRRRPRHRRHHAGFARRGARLAQAMRPAVRHRHRPADRPEGGRTPGTAAALAGQSLRRRTTPGRPVATTTKKSPAGTHPNCVDRTATCRSA